jgi:cystathionine beta-lyase
MLKQATFNFDERIERNGSNCFKWDFAPKIFGSSDILPMWVADMDFKSPPEVVDALSERVGHGIFGYGARPDSYYASFIAWAKKRYNFEIDKEHIQFSPGIVPALSLCVAAFTAPGDGVIIQPPVYPPFAGVVKDWGRKVLENNLKQSADGGAYGIDFADLEAKAKSGAKMLFLCAPHNPVGRVWRAEELERVLDICVKNNILVVSDEIHADIIYSGNRHICPATVSKKAADKMITLMSPSKTFNITGLSISSAVISDKKLREAFSAQTERLHISQTNVFGITAFEAAYTHGERWLAALLEYLENNRDHALEFISRELPQLTAIKPESTFLMWINFEKMGMKQDKLNEFIIKKARLGLNDGAAFGAAGNGFMRLNFACPRAVLDEGLSRLKNAVYNL